MEGRFLAIALGKIPIQVVATPLRDFALGVGQETRVVEAKRNLARVHPFGAWRSASHLKNAAFLLVYLYRAFSGGTLARKQMDPAISLAPGNPSTVMFLGACDR